MAGPPRASLCGVPTACHFTVRSGAVLLAVASASLAGCGSDPAEFVDPHGVVVWSLDDRPAELPADSPARSDERMFVDELRNAIVLAEDADRIIVVGDRFDFGVTVSALDETNDEPGRQRFAYQLDGDHRVVQQLGAIDGGSDMSNHRPGRRVAVALDGSAGTVFVTTSEDIHEVPVYTDPATGQAFAFSAARSGETLLRLDVHDDTGQVIRSLDVGPEN